MNLLAEHELRDRRFLAFADRLYDHVNDSISSLKRSSPNAGA